MFHNKNLVSFMPFLLCLLSVGCMTQTMHSNKCTYYKEFVSAVLITEDNSSLVVLGKNYHYVLKNIETIALIIKSPLHKKYKLEFVDANIGSDNKITGCFRIVIKNPNKEECSEAVMYGFTKHNTDMSLDIKLNGIRYLAGDIVPDDKYLLNDQYSISISEPEGGMKKALKIAATPITVAIDGALFLAHVPGIVLLLTFEDLR